MKARDEIIARVIGREGGVSQVPGESWITRWGQTPRWLKDFNLQTPTNAAEAADNYAEWMRRTRLDQVVGDVPDVLADIVVDYAVHSGHVPAIQALQAAVGVRADGVIGPVTLKAIEIDGDRRRAAAQIIAQRSEFQGELIARNPDHYSRYALGWARRQGEFIRALA